MSKYLRKTTKWVTDVSLRVRRPHVLRQIFGYFVRRFVRQFGRRFAPLLEPLWHSARFACPGTRIFNNLAHFNYFRRIRRPLSEHKALDRAPCKPDQIIENARFRTRKSRRVPERFQKWRESATKLTNKSANKIPKKSTQNVRTQDSQRDIGNPLGGFPQIFRQNFYDSICSRLGCILLH